MTGVEQLTALLFATLCTAITVRSIVRLVVAGRTLAANFQAQVDVHKATVEAQTLVFPPASWQREGEL